MKSTASYYSFAGQCESLAEKIKEFSRPRQFVSIFRDIDRDKNS